MSAPGINQTGLQSPPKNGKRPPWNMGSTTLINSAFSLPGKPWAANPENGTMEAYSTHSSGSKDYPVPCALKPCRPSSPGISQARREITAYPRVGDMEDVETAKVIKHPLPPPLGAPSVFWALNPSIPKQAADMPPASSLSKDEGKKLICVLRPFHFSQSNYFHLSISLQIRAHSAGLASPEAACPSQPSLPRPALLLSWNRGSPTCPGLKSWLHPYNPPK